MGRRKIEIEPIKDDRNRTVTFIKRKAGLFKKAHELSVLCQVDIAVIILGSNNTFYEYSSVDMGKLINVHQNNADLPHNVIEPSDYGDYVKKPHVVLNEKKRRRRRTAVLEPDSNFGNSALSGQNSSGNQSSGNLNVLPVSNEIEHAAIGTSLVNAQGNVSRNGSNISDHSKNGINYAMPRDQLHLGGGFYTNIYKDINGQQFQVDRVPYGDRMDKRMKLDSQQFFPGPNQPGYGSYYPSPYDNLPKPALPSNLMNNIPPVQSQFVQIIPANSNTIGRSFDVTNDNVTFRTRQTMSPPVDDVPSTSDGPAPVQTMVHHLNQLNRNRGKLSEKPALKLSIPKATADTSRESPTICPTTTSPKMAVQTNFKNPPCGSTFSPFSHSKILEIRSNDIKSSNHSGQSTCAQVNSKTFFLKPPIGRPPKFPKSPSTSIVIYPTPVPNPSSSSVNSIGSPK
ncbi:Smp1p [Saccharomyces eubayanus]|uniref:Smp1p n=1 Tax=Saccharomyces eubayanus TaxID=1080349 RepID=UPI0006C528E4|nr:SMP1-like protein [Saccharomyces eubayanus]KOH00497.1 SMP1-like protein [Saccharomyces eubayanus]